MTDAAAPPEPEAPAPKLTLCRRGEEPPPTFVRSVFLAAADGTPWLDSMVEKLKVAGFDDGVIFVGDELPAASTDWRAKAVLMSDAIVCYVSSSAPTSAYMAMEMSR